MSEIASFIIYNILVILFGSITYFIMKEGVRVSGGKLNKTGFLISSLVLGTGILLILISGGIYYNIPGIKEDNPIKIWLNPFVIYLIIVSVAIDKKLFISLILFVVLGEIITNKNIIFSGLNTKSLLTTLVFEIILYLFLGFMILIPIKARKKINNFLLTWIIFVLFAILEISLLNIENSLKKEPEKFSKLIQIYSVKLSYLILILSIQQIIIYFIERIYKNYNQLETFSIKDDISYYKISLATKELRKLIYEEKIETGVLLLLDIKDNNKEELLKILEYIKLKTSEIYKNSFYFKATTNYYGIFLPLENLNNIKVIFDGNKKVNRPEEDPLSDFDNIIFDVKNEYKVDINIGGSLYGIQSYDMDELLEFAKFLFSPTVVNRNNSRIIIYDFKRIKDRLKETIAVTNLPININNLDISFLKGVSKENIYYPSIICEDNLSDENNKMSSLNKILKGKLSVKEKSYILRHVSYQTLRSFDKKNSSVVIFYSEDYLGSNDFKKIEFIQKINRFMDVERVIIGLFISKKLNKKIIENINDLKNSGFRFALLNPTNNTQEQINQLKPNFLIELSDKKILEMESKVFNLKTNAVSLNFNLV